VVNPGPLPLGVTPQNVLHTTVRRNEHLARLFHDLKLMEREGSGFDKIFEVLLSQGRPAPELIETHDRVQVTVRRRILKPEVIDFIAKADQTYQLTQRERIALGLLAQHDALTARELAHHAGTAFNVEALQPWLKRLLDWQLVQSAGRTQATRYFVDPHDARNLAARQQIDAEARAGRLGHALQDMKQLNLGCSLWGVAVREYPTDTGPADYVLFVNRNAVGVIEAKKDSAGENLTATEARPSATPPPTSNGARTTRRCASCSRPPARSSASPTTPTRRRARAKSSTSSSRKRWPPGWRSRHPAPPAGRADAALQKTNLRDCQISAVTGLEKSLALNKPRALVHMATGAGKTFTAITSVYRLLKFGGAKRILFLVDTRNLGKQAHQEFMAYTPPDDGRKFTELYNVQRLASPNIDPHAQVCISTIQRMYSILSGEPIDESAEDVSLNEVQQTAKQEKLVRYNPAVPVETFDFIIIDECHRSIYNLWKQVLDYFDASLIGLTATPDKRTFGFFNENIVAEYTYEQSVADGVNVGYDVYEIETEITQKGAELKAKEWVDHRDRPPARSAGAKPRKTPPTPARSWTARWSTRARSAK
jgi:hypothetical protein